jgi:DUF2924 family protein
MVVEIRLSMRPDVSKPLTLLPTMGKPELLALWKQQFSGTAPRHLRRGLLVRVLAHKLQDQAYGGLNPTTKKRLRELARKFAANSHSELPGGHRIKPGTRLIRQWRGQSHQVTALEDTFEYAGRRYASLSEIARAITGTRWSGPMFFGLKVKRDMDRPHAQ